MALHFLYEDVDFKLPKIRHSSSWLSDAVKKEGSSIEEVTYVFCNDAFLININKQYLNHDTYTDIVTFDYSNESSKGVNGEIYISIERVAENALKFKKPFVHELHRVMIHGVLHLLGYNDKKASEKAVMRKKEEAYLSLYK